MSTPAETLPDARVEKLMLQPHVRICEASTAWDRAPAEAGAQPQSRNSCNQYIITHFLPTSTLRMSGILILTSSYQGPLVFRSCCW